MATLQGEAITVHRQDRPVLHGIDVAAAPGELLALLGPNGAGKTTLLKALAGLLPCRGRVTVDGQPLAGLTPARRAQTIAYLPQGAPAQWPMPVAAVVALGRQPHQSRFAPLTGRDHAAIHRAMAEADILALADRRLDTLSGGERARVLLARALAVEAPVLLADEPIAHLDPRHQLAVLELLRRRADQGDAVVVVLHDLAQAARTCHRVCLLDHGRLVAQGTPQQVLTDAVLAQVYGIHTVRGAHQGQDFLLPWTVVA